MASKNIHGLITFKDRDGGVIDVQPNVAFRLAAKNRVIYKWNNNYSAQYVSMYIFPWKAAYLLTDDDQTVGHSTAYEAVTVVYPLGTTSQALMSWPCFRMQGTIATVASGATPQVFGSVMSGTNYGGNYETNLGFGDRGLSHVDVPLDYTQIGIVYFHPAHQQSNTFTTTVGSSSITYTNAQFWDQYYVVPGVLGIVRIETGADAGYYFIQHQNFTNNNMLLRLPDGSNLIAQASAAVTATAAPGRRAFFNETSIIPLSVGTLSTSGRYSPRKTGYLSDPYLRESFVCRLTLEKTGSTEASAGTEQQGSYLMSLRPFTHGDGSTNNHPDISVIGEGMHLYSGVNIVPPWSVHFGGGVNGMALDWTNQRLWFSLTDNSNQSSLHMWRWKTSEGMREVATASVVGVAPQASYLTPTPVLAAGDVVTSISMGSRTGSTADWCYVGIYHSTGGNAGLLIIKPDRTTLQYNTSGPGGSFPNANLSGCIVDKSRARTGTATDASTDGSNNVTSASGQFTNSDIGRAIKLTGLGSDSGTYKISSVGGLTTVGVQTMAGGAVTFTSQSGGTYEIGDRVYFLFGNASTGAGKINYMESLSPGTWLTRTVSMTNGANTNQRVINGAGFIYGQKQACDIDQASGALYWLSNDTQQQVNKYDPSANTHAFIAISDSVLLNPPGGVLQGGASPATNPSTPTVFRCVKVSSKFNDVWVGTETGMFRIRKSSFGSTGSRRYSGTDITNYNYGEPQTTGTGNGTTGLSYSAPNMTLNATGTPFTAQMVGKYVIITGSSTAANNGVFPITAFNSTSQIVYNNNTGAGMATQANYAGTFHIVNGFGTHNVGSYNSGGSAGVSVRGFAESPDGRMWAYLRNDNTSYHCFAYYSQEADNWIYRGEAVSSNNNEAYYFDFVEPQSARAVMFHGSTAGGQLRFLLAGFETEYQWDGAKWVPFEWEKGGMPLKVNVVASDGGTTLGSATFTGSNFLSTHRYVRIESGGDIGIYRIGNFIGASSVDLVKLDGTTFSASANASGLSYTPSKHAQFGRPIHSTAQEVVYGVKVAWNRQGGATPPNNEFLGRSGQSRTTSTDGTTTISTGTFGGSSFTAGDVGKYLRIESGSGLLTDEYKVYRITAFISAAAVTIKLLNGTSFSASATTSGLTYTVWDPGTPGSNAGPENITFMLADGFGKDNTQDFGGVTFDGFNWKTRFHEYEEQHKFAVENPLALAGPTNISPALRAYFETYARVTRAAPTTGGQYNPALSHHRALPASELSNGRQMLDWHRDRVLDGTVGHADTYSSPGNLTDWHGTLASNSVLGCSAMVDLGKDAEIGFVQIRFKEYSPYAYLTLNATYHGLVGNLYNAANSGGTPVASYSQDGTGDTIGGSAPNMTWTDAGAAFTPADVGRYITIQGATTAANNGTFLISAYTSATSITYTNASGVAEAASAAKWFISSATARASNTLALTASADNTTLTAASGDFLGAITTGPFTNGTVTATQNTFVAPASTFVQSDRMKVLKITAGASLDLGSYRITAVSGDGSTVTVRALNQNTVAWNGSASGITYEVRNAVREEDQILFWDSGGALARCCVDRLLTTTTMQVRTAPSAAATTVNWWCLAPTWSHVKRLSHSTEALPPDTKNNGTWITTNGRNQYDITDGMMYFDLTDLPTAQRTGRWWKWSGLPRFGGDTGSDAAFRITSVEFFDVSGNKIGTSKYTSTNETQTNADFYFSWLSRVDFIQSANDALSGVTGKNGNADLGGANGDTITLTTGGNKFLGWQIGPAYTDGNPVNGGNTFNSTAQCSFPASATAGRFLWIRTGTNAGYYRILNRVSASQITVGPPSGTGSTVFSPTETGLTFSVHEGIAVGGTYPDKFIFRRLGTAGDVTTTVSTSQLNSASGSFAYADLGKTIRVFGATNDNGTYTIVKVNSSTQVEVTSNYGDTVVFTGGSGGTFEVDSDRREFRISAINDALTTITIEESLQTSLTNKPWQIWRPGYDTTSATTESAKFARIVRPGTTMPVQSGDVTQDHSGYYRFFSEDIGGAAVAAGTTETSGTGNGTTGLSFSSPSVTLNATGTPFTASMVGKHVVISGAAVAANNGEFPITAFNSTSSISYYNPSGATQANYGGTFYVISAGGGYQRADGVIAGGNGNFTGSGFSPDDVGRLLYIDTGVNMGVYEISVYTSATAITVKNHFTGAAVSFTADAGPVIYRVFGDRRFKLTKYATGLRA